jgi:quercetin dioxygenase-like cupin family protein
MNTKSESQAAAFVLRSGEARRDSWVKPTLKVGAADSGGLLSVYEGTLSPHEPGPPLHVEDASECMFVIEGSLTVQLDNEVHEVSSGGFVWIPRDTPHAWVNSSSGPTRVLGVSVPGGEEEMFRERAEYLRSVHGRPDPELLNAIAVRHGGRAVGPPLPVPDSKSPM